MSDLFKKLNVLIKSNLNDRISSEAGADRQRARPGKNAEAGVEALRERVNDAVKYEDEIKARVRQYEDEVARWDRQADDAVARGDDAAARYAIEQMRRAEQRATMTQSDLRQHQLATQDLIQHVNILEATVADAQRAAASQRAADLPSPPAEDAQVASPLPDLGNVLREARDKIASLGEMAAAGRETNPAAEQSDPEDAGAVDDDLERRRQRLSKR